MALKVGVNLIMNGSSLPVLNTPSFPTGLLIYSNFVLLFPTLSATGALYQIGMTGGAVFTTEIAIMSLLAVVRPSLMLAHDRKILFGMIAFAVVFLLVMTTIPANIESMHYGSTG